MRFNRWCLLMREGEGERCYRVGVGGLGSPWDTESWIWDGCMGKQGRVGTFLSVMVIISGFMEGVIRVLGTSMDARIRVDYALGVEKGGILL